MKCSVCIYYIYINYSITSITLINMSPLLINRTLSYVVMHSRILIPQVLVQTEAWQQSPAFDTFVSFKVELGTYIENIASICSKCDHNRLFVTHFEEGDFRTRTRSLCLDCASCNESTITQSHTNRKIKDKQTSTPHTFPSCRPLCL